jgi:hypothetical protein
VRTLRWIDTSAYEPDAAWQATSDLKTDELREMSDAERHEAFRKAAASRHWGKLREDLTSLGLDKCWYTEAKIGAGDAQVEHFRPKRPNAQGQPDSHGGYWWLAFDATNYRLAASVPNRSKSNDFPVRGTRAVAEGHSLDDELPLMLDPCDANDVDLLTFGDAGVPKPAPFGTAADAERVEYTADRCLKGATVERGREAAWNNARNAFRAWALAQPNAAVSPGARAKATAAATRMKEMVRPDAAYSSVAAAHLDQLRASTRSANDAGAAA